MLGSLSHDTYCLLYLPPIFFLKKEKGHKSTNNLERLLLDSQGSMVWPEGSEDALWIG